jgi:hypothetical protein
VVRFTEWAAWSKFFVVSSIEDVYLLASQAVVVAVHAIETISFRTGTADAALLSRVVASRCRVVLLLAASSDVLSVASLAKELGLDEGWAWLGLSDLAEVDREPCVPRFAGARSVMAGWVYFEAIYQAPSAFYDRVREATRSSFPQVYEPADPVSVSAANLYDAVMLWAVVAGRHSGKVYDGRRVTEWLRNVSFNGVGGRVELDTNGDMKLSIQLVNYVDDDGLIRDVVVGTYDAALQQYVPSANRSIIWPGGSAAIPSAALDTGDGNFSTTWLLVGGGCGALLIIGGLIVFMKKKYKGLEHILVMVVSEMSKLASTILLDSVNLITDGISCYRILDGSRIVVSSGYRASYAIFMCLASLTSVVGIFYRVRNAVLVQRHANELARATDLIEEDAHSKLLSTPTSHRSPHANKARPATHNENLASTPLVNKARPATHDDSRKIADKYEWELLQGYRSLVICGLGVMSTLFEGAAFHSTQSTVAL